jgi:hypothetical protein
MSAQLSEKWAKVNVVIIAAFYLISGAWEYLVGLTQAEGLDRADYFLLGTYRDYLMILGRITIIIGIVLLFRINFARIAAIILAWWNLFTGPLLYIWWLIYAVYIKKFLAITPSFFAYTFEITVLLAMTVIRIYIIYMLRISKSGYIFLGKNKKQDSI